jgi:hypothetical protein
MNYFLLSLSSGLIFSIVLSAFIMLILYVHLRLFTESEVVDGFLKNHWLMEKRNNKRLLKQFGLKELEV